MIKQVTMCDACGAEKGETNNWLLMFEESNPTAIKFEPFHISGFGKHICGHECAHKMLAQWMETQCKQQ